MVPHFPHTIGRLSYVNFKNRYVLFLEVKDSRYNLRNPFFSEVRQNGQSLGIVDWSLNHGDFWSLNVNLTSTPMTFTIVLRGDEWSGIDVMKQITI